MSARESDRLAALQKRAAEIVTVEHGAGSGYCAVAINGERVTGYGSQPFIDDQVRHDRALLVAAWRGPGLVEERQHAGSEGTLTEAEFDECALVGTDAPEIVLQLERAERRLERARLAMQGERTAEGVTLSDAAEQARVVGVTLPPATLLVDSMQTFGGEIPRPPRDEEEREAVDDKGRRWLAEYCPADNGGGYKCGRKPDHTGDHVCATRDGMVHARWPQSAPPPHDGAWQAYDPDPLRAISKMADEERREKQPHDGERAPCCNIGKEKIIRQQGAWRLRVLAGDPAEMPLSTWWAFPVVACPFCGARLDAPPPETPAPQAPERADVAEAPPPTAKPYTPEEIAGMRAGLERTGDSRARLLATLDLVAGLRDKLAAELANLKRSVDNKFAINAPHIDRLQRLARERDARAGDVPAGIPIMQFAVDEIERLARDLAGVQRLESITRTANEQRARELAVVRDALIVAVDGDVEPGETLVDTVQGLAARVASLRADRKCCREQFTEADNERVRLRADLARRDADEKRARDAAPAPAAPETRRKPCLLCNDTGITLPGLDNIDLDAGLPCPQRSQHPPARAVEDPAPAPTDGTGTGEGKP